MRDKLIHEVILMKDRACHLVWFEKLSLATGLPEFDRKDYAEILKTLVQTHP